MKAVILAGGFGTRLSEETNLIPKPMVEIGGRPIIWHIMKIYSAFGIHDFIICLGYRSYVIKEYFSNYMLHMCDVTINVRDGSIDVHQNAAEDWRITLVDTGLETMTGGRLRRVRSYLKDEEFFCFTYGDGVSDIDISELIAFHKRHGKLATVTAISPPGRFGSIEVDGDSVTGFAEKRDTGNVLINGGFFVLSPEVIEYIKDDTTIWERDPMEQLAHEGQMAAYRHKGFWQPMDTLRDKRQLEELWASGNPPWKKW